MNRWRIAPLALAAIVLIGCGKSSPASGGSGKITVSNIEKDGRNYTITLNDVITIRNVQIKSGRGGRFLAFPQRKGSGNRYWNYVKIERRDGDFLLAQVQNEEIAQTPSGFEITKVTVKPLEGGTGRTLAFVEFELNGVLTLHSWSLISSDRGPFLGSPRERDGDDWKDVVFATREFHDQLQEAALAEYGKSGSARTPAPAEAPVVEEVKE